MPTLPDDSAAESDADRAQPGAPRLFTVAQANALLPYLRGALSQAQAHLGAMRGCSEELAALEAVGRAPGGGWILSADHRAASARLAEQRAACAQLLGAIGDHGCQVKDLTAGLCDFPALIDGEPVLLCWLAGEPAVAHYHGYLDGFRGRRPIPPGAG